MDDRHTNFLKAAFATARQARANGNHPFGAVLIDRHGQILFNAQNTVVSSNDITGHAEINLVRLASAKLDREPLRECTVYASTEPCPMCSGAIFWADIRKVVYGLSEEALYELVGDDSEEVLHIPCREIFGRGRKPIKVIGPMLEEEAREVHKGFWNAI